MIKSTRTEFLNFHNGVKSQLPFSIEEYENRIFGIRLIMKELNLDAVVLTSMHNIAYYSGFLYCSFGRQYACVVTQSDTVTVSAGIDGGEPWRRSVFDNLTYTDWQEDNYWRAILSITGKNNNIGYESDHLTLQNFNKLKEFLSPKEVVDVRSQTMNQRMQKSQAEIALIRQGARIADLAGFSMREAIKVGLREIDIAIIGRDIMELEIAKTFPDSEIRDTWVWFQSGNNTDGAHNPVTARKLLKGDILSLNAFPMISGYYTALERTMFMTEVDPASLDYWNANIGAHELGISLIKPGVTCAEITAAINSYFLERDLLQYRSFGYGHSFGILSHYYGREGGLEFREDVNTTLVPGMVVSMEPMITIPDKMPGAGGYREHDILIITEDGKENITKYPYGPEFNIV